MSSLLVEGIGLLVTNDPSAGEGAPRRAARLRRRRRGRADRLAWSLPRGAGRGLGRPRGRGVCDPGVRGLPPIRTRGGFSTPAEAVRAATAGGARALRRTDVGVLRVGARADLVQLDAPSHVHLAYRPGVPLVRRVWKDGEQRGPRG
jgi:Amidohydrolase family